MVSGVRRMNEVNARRARLVLGWATVFGRVYQLGQLSLASLWVALVWRAGVLTCGSCHLERSARSNPHRGDPVKFRKLLKSHHFSQFFSRLLIFVFFLVF